jgi:hypothetical protein
MENRVRSSKRRAMFIQTLRNDPNKRRKDNRGRGRTVRNQTDKGNITAIPVITSSALTPVKVPPTPQVSTTVVRTPKRPTYVARSGSHNPVRFLRAEAPTSTVRSIPVVTNVFPVPPTVSTLQAQGPSYPRAPNLLGPSTGMGAAAFSGQPVPGLKAPIYLQPNPAYTPYRTTQPGAKADELPVWMTFAAPFSCNFCNDIKPHFHPI